LNTFAKRLIFTPFFFFLFCRQRHLLHDLPGPDVSDFLNFHVKLGACDSNFKIIFLINFVFASGNLCACRPTFYRIYKSKSTEGFQSVPYVVALFSAMLWIFYAVIKTGELLLITINAAGIVIESIYIIMYFIYAPKKSRLFTAKIMLGLNVGFFGLIMLVTLLFFKGDKRVVSLGWICVGFSVSVFVAPLSIIVSSTSSLNPMYSLHSLANRLLIFVFFCMSRNV
jgi:uncharacterized protein with PQ loop repeat